jgi:hypothetical protein
MSNSVLMAGARWPRAPNSRGEKGKQPSTARRQYVSGSCRRIARKNNVSPRAELAR